MKPLRLSALLIAAAFIPGLAACQQEPAPQPSADATEMASAPDARPGIATAEGRMVLPVVSGRPAAVYFTMRNQGDTPATLAGVHVAGAGKAEMHKTEGGMMSPVDSVELASGASLAFAPGGYHVMAFDLDPSLAEGGTTELTLTFSDGDKLSMPLRIERMGEGMGEGMGGDMAGMHH